jgi:hypothetical protein
MSTLAVAWAWEQTVAKNEKLLLLFLADSADRFGRGDLDVLRDAPNVCGMDIQTVQTHLASLEKSGRLRRLAENSYRLAMPKPELKAFRFEEP